jgi:tetratricopeptide (TPR) repeat protein
MWAALSMFVVSLSAIGAYSAYHHFAVPKPVELGTAAGALEDSEAPTTQPVPVTVESETPSQVQAAETTVTASAAATSTAAAPSIPVTQPQVHATFSVTLHTADMLAHSENPRAALGVYDAALQLAPNSAPALAGKAALHLSLGEHAAAKQLAERALELDATNSLGWMVLGSVEDHLGATAAAQAAYRQCADRGVGAHVPECRRLVAKR